MELYKDPKEGGFGMEKYRTFNDLLDALPELAALATAQAAQKDREPSETELGLPREEERRILPDKFYVKDPETGRKIASREVVKMTNEELSDRLSAGRWGAKVGVGDDTEYDYIYFSPKPPKPLDPPMEEVDKQVREKFTLINGKDVFATVRERNDHYEVGEELEVTNEFRSRFPNLAKSFSEAEVVGFTKEQGVIIKGGPKKYVLFSQLDTLSFFKSASQAERTTFRDATEGSDIEVVRANEDAPPIGASLSRAETGLSSERIGGCYAFKDEYRAVVGDAIFRVIGFVKDDPGTVAMQAVGESEKKVVVVSADRLVEYFEKTKDPTKEGEGSPIEYRDETGHLRGIRLDNGEQVFIDTTRETLGTVRGLNVKAYLNLRRVRKFSDQVPKIYKEAISIQCIGFTRDGKIVLAVKEEGGGDTHFFAEKALWVAENLSY